MAKKTKRKVKQTGPRTDRDRGYRTGLSKSGKGKRVRNFGARKGLQAI